MNKLIVYILVSFMTMGSVHPPLNLRGSGVGKYLEESLGIELVELYFERDRYGYNINFINNYGNVVGGINIEDEREILSVFYDDVSGNGSKDVFLITRVDDKNIIEVIGEGIVGSWIGRYDIERNYVLAEYLTEVFADTKDLNASMVREVTRKRYPLDYSSLEHWIHNEDGFYSHIDLWGGDLVGEGRSREEIMNEDSYYLGYGDNIYGWFKNSPEDGGFQLVAIFEGYFEGGKAVYNGRFESRDTRSYYKGEYEEGKEIGMWREYNNLDGEVKVYYEDGVEVRRES